MTSDCPLVDTHCHLDFDAFDDDIEEVVDRASAAGVGAIIVPTLDLDDIPKVLALADTFPSVYAAVGIHPNSSAGWDVEYITQLRDAAAHPRVVAIGEIGLDYYWDRSPREVQNNALKAQLALAGELNLPVILHNRDSSADLLAQLRASPLAGREQPGVLHSFSADWATAKAALDMGFYLGFTGPLTYKKADELRDIARRAPLERLLVETDAPFLTPQPYRGKRNEPAYVRFIAERLAEVRELDLAEICRVTTANASRLFALPEQAAAGLSSR